MTDTNCDSNLAGQDHVDGPCSAAPELNPDHGLIDSIASLVDQLQSKEDQYAQLVENQNLLNQKIDESQNSINSLTSLVERLANTIPSSMNPNSDSGNDQLPHDRQESNSQQEIDAPADPPSEPDAEIPEQSAWEIRKAELLKGFSDDEDDTASNSQQTPPVCDARCSQEPAITETNNDEADGKTWLDSGDADLESPVESDEIVELRRKLEEKLRRAEIEVSIERANISRIRQDLDQQQLELKRQVSKHENQVSGSKENRKRGRWSKFLGSKK